MSSHKHSPKSLHIDLVEDVAAREGVSPLDLPPLYDSIDREVTESLTSPASDIGPLLFSYCGYDVAVTGDGRVTVVSGE